MEVRKGLTPLETADLMNTQKQWIKKRASCGDDEGCIENSFYTRLAELSALRDAKGFNVRPAGTNTMIYHNEEFGFEITYPKGMTPTNIFGTSYMVGRLPEREIPIVNFVVARPENVCLPMVELRITARPGKPKEQACSMADLKPGVMRRTGDLSDGGMSHSIEGNDYEISHNGYCLTLERFMETGACDKKQPEWSTLESYYPKTKDMIDSFHFLEK
jgi:hypothetical protein